MMTAYEIAERYRTICRQYSIQDTLLNITVIDKEPEVASLSSFANAGSISPDGPTFFNFFPLEDYLKSLTTPVDEGGIAIRSMFDLDNGKIPTEPYKGFTIPKYRDAQVTDYIKRQVDYISSHEEEIKEDLLIKTKAAYAAMRYFNAFSREAPDIAEAIGLNRPEIFQMQPAIINYSRPGKNKTVAEGLVQELHPTGGYYLNAHGAREITGFWSAEETDLRPENDAQGKAIRCLAPYLEGFFRSHPDAIIVEQPGISINSRLLVQELEKKLNNMDGINFRFQRAEVTGMQHDGDRVAGLKVITPEGHEETMGSPADTFVIAPGANHQMRDTIGMTDKIPPSMGYAGTSITIPVPEKWKQLADTSPLIWYRDSGSPVMSFIKDPDNGDVFLRIGGLYAFTGEETPSVGAPEIHYMIEEHLKLAAETLPDLMQEVFGKDLSQKKAITEDDIAKANPWVGIRPVAYDLNISVGPIASNCHFLGHLGSFGMGWSALVADRVADLVMGATDLPGLPQSIIRHPIGLLPPGDAERWLAMTAVSRGGPEPPNAEPSQDLSSAAAQQVREERRDISGCRK